MEAIACFRIESQYENACFDPWYNGNKDRDPPRTRTWNLRLRGPTPYPLGQRASYDMPSQALRSTGGPSCRAIQEGQLISAKATPMPRGMS